MSKGGGAYLRDFTVPRVHYKEYAIHIANISFQT